jgi:hypothetical protein
MLQLHDSMKRDLNYQRNCPQLTVEFPTGSVWICFSDQTSHAAMSGYDGANISFASIESIQP